MHTSGHTKRRSSSLTVANTILKHGSYYYNRRVPKQAVGAFGALVRIHLSSDAEEARCLSEGLTERLNSIWSGGNVPHGVDLHALLDAARPRSFTLTELAEEYLSFKNIDAAPLRLAVSSLVAAAGDKSIADYDRQDARAFVSTLQKKGNSTGTIRRRIGPLSALLNYGFSELDIEKRNPFTRLHFKGEGDDRKKRGTFTSAELTLGYFNSMLSGSEIRLLMPILGETGCRIGEIVGLRLKDIDLDEELIRITPHSARRLKTRGSERELPLVGLALVAMKLIVGNRTDDYLFPRYLKDGSIRSTHASNAFNKTLRKDFPDRTAHSLRHTFRDRLRAVECPLELIDSLGGWSSVGTVGSSYGLGYSLSQKRNWIEKMVREK